jgi:serine/threonine-protein kinase
LAEIGSIIDGKYEILKQIGKGGMSKVYLAMDRRLNKQWAIKEVEKFAHDTNKNEIVVNSVIAEANLVKTLDNYYLPRINDILDDGKVIYVVMDYVEGESLQKILKTEGAQPQKHVLKWGKQLCEVLNYLHSRRPPIIYRDMKPGNVMIKPDGDVKLIDFGIAREFKEQGGSDTTSLGTRGYAAPEQFAGGTQTDPRTDIYNLGATLYHAITGHDPSKEPYVMHPIRYWNPKLSGGLEKIILKCTMADPNERYQSAVEVLYALNHYDEVDEIYRRKQKGILKGFISVAALFLFFTAFGIFSLGWSSHLVNEDYNAALHKADTSSDEKQAATYYKDAIIINPERADAYGLDAKENGRDESRNLLSALSGEFNGNEYILDKDEAKELDALLSDVRLDEDLIDIWERQGYLAEMAYRIGNIYWKYYIKSPDSGNANENNEVWLASKMDRPLMAMKWFDYVIKSENDARVPADDPRRVLAQAYYDIGMFTKQRLNDKDEDFDAATYIEHFEKLKSTFELLKDSDDKQAKLTLDSFILDDLYENQINYQAADIGEQQLLDFIDDVDRDVRSIDVAENQTNMYALKTYLEGERIQFTKERIAKTYGEGTETYEPNTQAG